MTHLSTVLILHLLTFSAAPFTTSSTEYVTITNNSNEAIAFKVKTTAPKIYCVRPNAAVVPPGEQVQIQVILLGLSEEPAADFKCKDKFLLITLPSPYDLGETSVAEAWPQLEAEFKQQAVSKKIKVKYLLAAEAKPGPTTDVVDEEKVDQTKEETAPAPAPASSQPIPKEQSNGAPLTKNQENASVFNPALVLLAALLALVLGWLYY